MTTVVRWHPIRDIDAMQDAMRMLNDTWRDDRHNWNSLLEKNELDRTVLPVDVYETEDAYTIVVSLPGVKAEDLDVRLRDGFLTIKGEILSQNITDHTYALLQERAYGKFVRRVRLPQLLNTDSIEASYHDGILTLNIPKAEEGQPRFIPVKPRQKEQTAS